jgi:hypothetical protein
MKRIFKITLFAAGMFAAVNSQAQTHKDSTLGHKVGKAATNVGHKTSEVASKGTAKVTDKTYKGKMGPDGQTIYINNQSKYFYVNKTGKRVYLNKSELRDKPSK